MARTNAEMTGRYGEVQAVPHLDPSDARTRHRSKGDGDGWDPEEEQEQQVVAGQGPAIDLREGPHRRPRSTPPIDELDATVASTGRRRWADVEADPDGDRPQRDEAEDRPTDREGWSVTQQHGERARRG
jgi:hypothetical protein